MDLFLKITRVLETDEVECAMGLVWAIWRARNSMVWNEEATNIGQSIKGVIGYINKLKEVSL